MGVQKKQPDEIVEPVQEQPQEEATVEEPDSEPIGEIAPKKAGRPKKEKKPRTPAQLANDEKQRQRFKREHEARKKKAAEAKPEETKAEPEPPVPEPVPEELAEESEPEVDEETVYIKRKPRKKTKRTYVIEPSSSDESSEDERPRRGYQRVDTIVVASCYTIDPILIVQKGETISVTSSINSGEKSPFGFSNSWF